jgi:hypothetical protein
MDLADRAFHAVMVNNAGIALYRLAQRGAIRKIIVEPEVWWELATLQTESPISNRLR